MAETGIVHFGSAAVPHEPVDFACANDGMTRQEFQDECDINKLMERYEKTGMLPQQPQREAFYGDFTDLPTFQEAQHIVMQAEAAFASLPARVRREFADNPAMFVDFASNPENIDKMREWGLAPEVANADVGVNREPPAPPPPPQAAPKS